MDDLSLMSSTVSGAQTLHSRCTTALTWAGLEFRADKSCSTIIIKGRSMNTTPSSVPKAKDQLEPSSSIPPIHSRPVKFLGCIIDGSLSDRNSSAELADKLLAELKTIDRSHFTGTQKLWILQHLLIPRIQWPLPIYEVPISLVFKLEQKFIFIRKWLHLHHSTSSLCFYSSASPCPLPIKSLSSALKASKISGHLLLRNSQDPLISSCGPKLRTGAWKVEDTVLSCESNIKFNKICGSEYKNRLGLGYTTTFKVPKSKSPCPLPIKSLSSALKASKISGHLLLRNSQNPLISSCGPKLHTGAWKVEDTVLSCESELNLIKSVEANIITSLGLDTPPLSRSQKANLQKTTRDIYQATTEQLTTVMPCPKPFNCRFKVSGQDG